MAARQAPEPSSRGAIAITQHLNPAAPGRRVRLLTVRRAAPLRQVSAGLPPGVVHPGVVHPGVVEPRSLLDARAVVDARVVGFRLRRGWHGAVAGSLSLTLIVSDLAAVGVAAAVVRPAARDLLIYVVLLLAGRASSRAYRPRLHLSVLDDLPQSLGTAVLATGVVVGLEGALAGDPSAARRALALGGLTLLVAGVLQVLAMGVARTLRRSGAVASRTLVLGAGRVGVALADSLLDHRELGLLPVGFVDPDALTAAEDLPLPLVSKDLGALSQTIAEHRVDTVVMAFSGAREAHLVDTVITADRNGCAVLVVPRLFELHADGADVERIRGVPLVRLRSDPTRRPAWWIKRAADIVLGAVGLLVLAPLLLAVALAVLLESGRPVLFWQERVGLDGHAFRLCKFRSLRPVSEVESQSTWTVAKDPRVGPVGRLLRKTSIDEFPQLWNILRGEMSLVGPRPERPGFVAQFSGEHERYWARHRVPVGLTGLAQVSGLRGDTSIRERARYDNYYIANWSLWLDVKILLMTAKEVLRGGGA